MPHDKLAELRKQIDEIDSSILDLLERRMDVTDQVGAYKRENNVSILQKGREESLKENLKSRAKHLVLKDTIGDIYQQIIETSKTSMYLNNLSESPYKKVAIIGLGVMGGSIAKTLKIKNKNIILSTINRESADTKEAIQSGIIDKTYSSIDEIVLHNELIVLACPIHLVSDIAKSIAKVKLSENKHITIIDIASVKTKISSLFQELSTDTLTFVPTHPMAGSEKEGFAKSSSHLFIQRPWIISPHAKIPASTIELVKKFIASLGSNPIVMDYSQHDINAAIVSHLVFVISTYLLAFAQAHPESLQLAGTGFETTTRLASGNVLMHKEIVEHNYQNLIQQLQAFIEFIKNNPITKDTAQKFFEKNKKDRDQFIEEKK